MASIIQLFNDQSNTVADTPEKFYTAAAGGEGVRIDALTASNNSTSNKSYKAYISINTPTSPLKPFQIVVWGEIDLGSGVVNQVIPAGYSLWLESSEASSIFFTASGRSI
jgi:hypothetical protein